jgi:predicted ribosome quality control (RQC) complex YloA/Tae2 family protein
VEKLQPMDATALKAVVGELRRVLVPSRCEQTQQAGDRAVQLAFRTLDGFHWIELAWQAEAPRLLAIPPPPRQGEGSTLARQLRHGLRGLALTAIEQPGWERVVELAFARRPGEPIERWLVLELMGRHSNLFLLDGERRVTALGRQVRGDQSRLRPIGTGDSYRPPPPMGGEPPRQGENEASWRRRIALQPLPLGEALRRAYQGIGPALARQLCEGLGDGEGSLLEQPVQDLDPQQWQALYRRWRAWLACVEAGRFRLRFGGASDYRCWQEADGTPAAADDPLAINHGLARYYAERLAGRDLRRRRQLLDQRLRAALERVERDLERQRQALAAVADADGLSRRADALLSRPDPDRSTIEEAQSLYRRARKLRRSVAAIEARLEEDRHRQAWLEASLGFLEAAGNVEEMADLEHEVAEALGAGGAGTGRSRRRGAGPPGETAPQPLELRTPGGLRLQVGRNHRQNEWISLRRARSGDLWFHAQECPGSHVVLKASEASPAEADLEAAADLAAHFSRGRGNARVPVVMVPTDDLQRIAGAAAGTVRHRGGQVLWGRPERAMALLSAPNLAGKECP